MRILIATHKSWNIERAEKLSEKEKNHEIKIITTKEELNEDAVKEFNPDFIFFPHWSYYIPKEIYEGWECIVFHMTDLPFGRGGSPLQNLIVRGIKNTKISAIRVVDELDAGDVYMKEDLALDGAACEIFDRASGIIFDKMIPAILKGDLKPKKQEGEVVSFKRRKKEDGEILPDMEPEKIYDYIRMLDAEGYPNAFMKFGDYVLEFTDASLDDETVTAKVTIHRPNLFGETGEEQ